MFPAPGMTIFGSLLLLLLILVEAAPPTASAVPLLGKYIVQISTSQAHDIDLTSAIYLVISFVSN